MNFEKLISKVEEAGHEVFWQGATSEDQISKLEGLLKKMLPPSFRNFLKEYGGGGVIDAEISGIEENNALLDNGGTVYGDTLTAREDYGLPDNLIVIFYRDDEICWCLDTDRQDSNGEYPVVSYGLHVRNIDKTISKSFEEFFIEYLELRGNS